MAIIRSNTCWPTFDANMGQYMRTHVQQLNKHNHLCKGSHCVLETDEDEVDPSVSSVELKIKIVSASHLGMVIC